MAQRIFLTGGTGFFGVHAAAVFLQRGYQVALGTRQPVLYAHTPLAAWVVQANILNQEELFSAVRRFHPDLIIHSAAYSNPLQAEQHPVRALEMNVVGTSNVIGVATALEIPVVFLSTDLVFDGQKGNYVEEDVAKPIIEYGRTKLLAESLFHRQVLLSRWIIVRTSLMFGHPLPWNPGYPGFASEALRQGKTVRLFTDQYRSPVLVSDVADAILRLWQAQHWRQLFHVGGPERINRVDFVRRFCHIAGIPTTGIVETTMEEVPEYTTRVRDVSLNTAKLQRMLQWQPTPLEEAFHQLIAEPSPLEQIASSATSIPISSAAASGS